MIRKAIFSIIAATIAMTTISISRAATTASPAGNKPVPTAAPAQPEQPALHKLDMLCKAATGLTYQARVSVSSPGVSSTAKYDVDATFQKPNLLSLSVSQGGKETAKVVSGSKTCGVLDPSVNQYASFDTPADWRGIALGIYHNSPRAAAESVLLTIDTIQKFNTSFALFNGAPTSGLTTKTLTATLNSKPVTDIRESLGLQGLEVIYDAYLDPATNLPVRTSQQVLKNNVTKISIVVDYVSFQLGSAPSAESTFAFTPPTGATLYTAPSGNAAQPAEKPVLANGKMAPDFAVTNRAGKTVHLSDYKGRVVVIDFWATWCGPCQDSLPGTDKIAGVYQPKGVKFLPICSWDEKPAFQTWVAKRASWNMNFYYDPAGSAADNIAAKLYSVSGIPTQFVIGKDGKIIMSNIGDGGEESEAQLKQALNKALAG